MTKVDEVEVNEAFRFNTLSVFYENGASTILSSTTLSSDKPILDIIDFRVALRTALSSRQPDYLVISTRQYSDMGIPFDKSRVLFGDNNLGYFWDSEHKGHKMETDIPSLGKFLEDMVVGTRMSDIEVKMHSVLGSVTVRPFYVEKSAYQPVINANLLMPE